MMQKIIVTAAIIDDTGRVLLCKRPDGVRYAGLWEFPGGKIEAGETCEATIIREVSEEIGLDVQAACLAPLCFATETSDQTDFVILLYIVRVWNGNPQPFAASELRWVSPMQIRDYPMPPANQHLVAMLRDVL